MSNLSIGFRQPELSLISLLTVPFWTPAALQVVLLRGISPKALLQAELCPAQASQPG